MTHSAFRVKWPSLFSQSTRLFQLSLFRTQCHRVMDLSHHNIAVCTFCGRVSGVNLRVFMNLRVQAEVKVGIYALLSRRKLCL